MLQVLSLTYLVYYVVPRKHRSPLRELCLLEVTLDFLYRFFAYFIEMLEFTRCTCVTALMMEGWAVWHFGEININLVQWYLSYLRVSWILLKEKLFLRIYTCLASYYTFISRYLAVKSSNLI